MLEFLLSRPVFTREEFAAFLRAAGVASGRTVGSHLRRYLAAGRLTRV